MVFYTALVVSSKCCQNIYEENFYNFIKGCGRKNNKCLQDWSKTNGVILLWSETHELSITFLDRNSSLMNTELTAGELRVRRMRGSLRTSTIQSAIIRTDKDVAKVIEQQQQQLWILNNREKQQQESNNDTQGDWLELQDNYKMKGWKLQDLQTQWHVWNGLQNHGVYSLIFLWFTRCFKGVTQNNEFSVMLRDELINKRAYIPQLKYVKDPFLFFWK